MADLEDLQRTPAERLAAILKRRQGLVDKLRALKSQPPAAIGGALVEPDPQAPIVIPAAPTAQTPRQRLAEHMARRAKLQAKLDSLRAQRRTTPAPQPPPKTWEGKGTIGGDMRQMVRNIPGSAVGVAEGLFGLLDPQTYKAMAQIGGGSLDVLMGKQTESAKLAKAAWHEMTRLARDPRSAIIDDPIGILLDVASIAFPAGQVALRGTRAGAVAGQVASAARKAHPINIVAKGAKALAKRKGVVKVTDRMAGIPERLRGVVEGAVNVRGPLRAVYTAMRENLITKIGQRTGTGEQAAKILHLAGRQVGPGFGGKGGGKVASYKKGKKAPDETIIRAAQDVFDAYKESKVLAGMRMDDAIPTFILKDVSNPIAPRQVRAQFKKDLAARKIYMEDKILPDGQGQLSFNYEDAHGIRVNIPEQNFVNEVSDVLARWGDDASIQGTWGIRKDLDKIYNKTSGIDAAQFKDAQAIITELRDRITYELESKVHNFAEANKDFRDAMEFIELAAQSFGINPDTGKAAGMFGTMPVINENMLTKVGSLLNTRLNQNLGTRKNVARELEAVMKEKRLRDAGVPVWKALEEMKQTVGLTGDDRLRIIDDLATKHGITDVNFFEELAGARFGSREARGLAGRLQGSGGAIKGGLAGGAFGLLLPAVSSGLPGGAMAVAAAGSILGGIYRNSVIGNPRLMGKVLVGLGATERVAKQTVRVFERVAAATPAKMVADGITFGAAVNLLSERSQARIEAEKILAGDFSGGPR